MDDMAGKIRDILSDEESMKQLEELAQMFSSSESDGTASSAEQSDSSPQDNIFADFDITKLLKLQNVMSSSGNDDTSGLLLALKPLLKEERRQKVDKAVKIMRLFSMWEFLKESGLMNDFFG